MKVLLIGLGAIGKSHLNSLRAIAPNTEVLALRSSKEARGFDGVTNLFALEEAYEHTIDFAIISNPTAEHKNTIEKLVPLQIPLFIEKPLHFNAEIGELVKKICEKKIITYVGCNLRFLDCLKFVRQSSQEFSRKRLNEVNVYCGSYLPEWRPDSNFRSSYSCTIKGGGGVHLDLIHELDYIYWLFGAPYQVIRNLRSKSSLGIESMDYANYLLDYDGFAVSVVLNYFRRDRKRTLELVFEDETWTVDLLTNTVKCMDRVLFESDRRIQDTYHEQMKYFIDCVRGKKASFNSVLEAYEVLKISVEV